MISPIQVDTTVLKRIALLNKKGRLGHAYLLIGPADIGKGETALAAAKTVLCAAGADSLFCDICPSCQKINTGAHPDVFIIDNEPGESIKIAQIRALRDFMRLRPFFGKQKIVIIRNIEKFTLESANAFLKTLEEPSADVHILLTTSVLEQNLETIRSRCQAVYFRPLSVRDLEGRLRKEHDASREQAHFLAHFAQGCPGAAQRLMDSGVIGYKDEVLDGFVSRRVGDDYMKATVADKAQTRVFLNILLSWIRDAILVQCGVDDQRLAHWDRREQLKKFAGKFTFEELDELNGSVINMYRLLAENLNIKLPLMIIGEHLWQKS